ncbi:siderophore-interacting protein [Bifidobacterium aquikefiricola]|uniref:Siderophore-interacting protein n=1 Tax=Bifidobacterium aquikefiricola TaxID=3059038 RepID=A0AB39U6V6_9BIFI
MNAIHVSSQRIDKDDRPGSRPYRVHVAQRIPLSPSFVRLVFEGDDLVNFGTDGFDQRMKLLLPLDGNRWGDPDMCSPQAVQQGSWWERWCALPPKDRNPMRTYTIRAIDPQSCQLTVDCVLHANPGPAGAFAQRAQPGDEIFVIGPDAHSIHSAEGIDFHPGDAKHLLLIGDETAVPGIGGILSSLHQASWHGQGMVLLEIPYQEDIAALKQTEGFRNAEDLGLTVDWVARSQSCHATEPTIERGASLITRMRKYAATNQTMLNPGRASANGAASQSSALEDVDVDKDLLWETPESATGRSFYSWMAGEASVIRTLRRMIVQQFGVNRSAVAFMGYWRAGKPEM